MEGIPLTREAELAQADDKYQFKLKHNRGSGKRESGIRQLLQINHDNAVRAINNKYDIAEGTTEVGAE